MGLLADIKTRLESVDAVKSVKGAARLSSARADKIRDTAFIFFLNASAGDNGLVNGVRQQVTIRFAVLLAIGNQRDQRGESGMSEVEIARDQVLMAMLGWMPDGEYSAVIYRGGRLVDIRENVLWWQDEFETTRLISAV